jgi:hypothetical protein
MANRISKIEASPQFLKSSPMKPEGSSQSNIKSASKQLTFNEEEVLNEMIDPLRDSPFLSIHFSGAFTELVSLMEKRH